MAGPDETLGSPWIPLPIRACFDVLAFVLGFAQNVDFSLKDGYPGDGGRYGGFKGVVIALRVATLKNG
jgi:hypothetical protein